MKIIYKYEVNLVGITEIKLNSAAIISHVGWQYGFVYIWVEQQEKLAEDDPIRLFRIFGTGEPIPNKLGLIGTAQEMGQSLVWHVYEVKQ